MPDPTDEELARQIITELLGGSSTATRPLEKYSESELRQLWRAGRLDEAAWKAELIARGATEQAAADQIATQKNVGVSTAAKTKGQLTDSEQAAVTALQGSVLAAPTATAATTKAPSSPLGAAAGKALAAGATPASTAT